MGMEDRRCVPLSDWEGVVLPPDGKAGVLGDRTQRPYRLWGK